MMITELAEKLRGEIPEGIGGCEAGGRRREDLERVVRRAVGVHAAADGAESRLEELRGGE